MRVKLGVRAGTKDFNKVKFLYVIKDVRKVAFINSTIRSLFKKAGI